MQIAGNPSLLILIPHLVSYNENEDLPSRNEPILKFKELIDGGRYLTYLKTLPKREQNRKLRAIKKLYPTEFY